MISRGYSLVAVWASLCSGFSVLQGTGSRSSGLQQLEHTGSVVVGLVAPWHVESSQTRNRTYILCIGRRILMYCTTREVLGFGFNMFLSH